MVQSKPTTIKGVFERHNTKIGQLSSQPPYLRDNVKDGHGQVVEIDAHKALILVRVKSPNCIDVGRGSKIPSP